MAIDLSDLIDPKQIALHLRARTQAEAIREIVDLLVANGKIDNRESFLDELQAREKTNSTYAADGVAFPHARTKLVEKILVGVGRSEAGIPWTEKGEIAYLIFLIAVPERCSAITWSWLARSRALQKIGPCGHCCSTPKAWTILSRPFLARLQSDFFSKRFRARSRIFFSFSVKLPIPDLAILSRIGSTDA